MSNNISTVRQHLLDTLADLRDRDRPMEVERAKAVAEVARVLVDSAKVEVEFLKVTNQDNSEFLTPSSDEGKQLPPGITAITRHVLK